LPARCMSAAARSSPGAGGHRGQQESFIFDKHLLSIN
jgi:hypothetical protein